MRRLLLIVLFCVLIYLILAFLKWDATLEGSDKDFGTQVISVLAIIFGVFTLKKNGNPKNK